MKTMKLAAMCLLFAGIATAKAHDDYQKGTLLRMDSSSCGLQEKDGKTNKNSQSKKTRELLCQEYILQGEQVVYRIRPTDEKHPALLPIGGAAEFRVHKDKLLMRVLEGDGKEREYIVVSMTAREDKTAPAQSASKN